MSIENHKLFFKLGKLMKQYKDWSIWQKSLVHHKIYFKLYKRTSVLMKLYFLLQSKFKKRSYNYKILDIETTFKEINYYKGVLNHGTLTKCVRINYLSGSTKTWII